MVHSDWVPNITLAQRGRIHCGCDHRRQGTSSRSTCPSLIAMITFLRVDPPTSVKGVLFSLMPTYHHLLLPLLLPLLSLLLCLKHWHCWLYLLDFCIGALVVYADGCSGPLGSMIRAHIRRRVWRHGKRQYHGHPVKCWYDSRGWKVLSLCSHHEPPLSVLKCFLT